MRILIEQRDDDPAVSHRGRRPRRAWIIRLLTLILGAGLLSSAFLHAPISDIGSTLALISPWQIAAILTINIGFHILMGLRWWLLARDDIPTVRLRDLSLVRLSAFAVSYFTPGPQFGGEPLQIIHLRRRYGASLARAGATVTMDRLIELLSGFVFLLLGATALLHEGLLQKGGSFSPAAVVPLLLVAGWPALHIVLLRRGFYPVSRLLGMIPAPRVLARYWRLTRAAEHFAGRLCQRRPRAILSALVVSLLAPFLAVMEYGLITSFLGMRLTAWQVLAGWTAGWIAFLIPLPGALGALEGSQIVALGSFGIPPAAALGAALLLRARDLLFGGAGLLLAAQHVHRAADASETVNAA